jgi:long-subunit fatty acid transport protein
MGGAFIAIADDATAASWNPSGLIQLEQPELSVVGAYLSNDQDFSASSNTEVVSNYSDDFTSLNYFSASYPFNLRNRNMVVSINYQRLYEFKLNYAYQFNATVPLAPPFISLETTQDVDYAQDGYLGAIGLAYAVELTPRISFGFTINIWTDSLGWKNGWDETLEVHRETIETSSLGPPQTTLIDVRINNEYSEFRGLNANLGILWNLNEYFTIGAVLKTPFTATLKHQYNREDTADSFEEDIELDMPMSYGIGLAYRFSDQFSVDLDIYRTEWSQYLLTDEEGNKFSPIDGLPKDESDIKDTTQIRFGGEYLILNPEANTVIPIRAGFFYDPAPAENNDNKFYGISLGSGIGYKRFVFDLAYQLRWGNDVNTDTLIANSEADITQHTVLFSMIYHF